ncbi:hypothetical protein LXL04_023111 [Taraxacum kok-saghyz]
MAASNNEWLQIYPDNLTRTSQPTVQPWSDHGTDGKTVTTTASNLSNQEGRVTRPTNTGRRSRTSRRTPTTLLNTDITNFRALVQQFTGRGSSPPAIMAAPATVTAPLQPSTSYNSNSSSFNYYGMGSRFSPPAVGGYNVELQQPPHQQYYTMAVENGEAGGDLHHRSVQRVQRVQDGNEVANFWGENNDGGKDNTIMF